MESSHSQFILYMASVAILMLPPFECAVPDRVTNDTLTPICADTCECLQLHADCSLRKITTIGGIRQYNLISINFTGNAMVRIASGTFQHNLKLHTIDLSDNRLSYLPDQLLYNLRSLVYLDISSNHLSYNQFSSTGFTSLVNLQVLKINVQKRTKWHQVLPTGLLLPLSSLKELHMIGNTLPPELASMTTLTILILGDDDCYIPNTSLPSVSTITALRQLTVLSLRNCHTSFMSRGFFRSFPELQRLDVSFNAKLGHHLSQALGYVRNSRLEVLLADKVSSRPRTVTIYSILEPSLSVSTALDLHQALSYHPNLTALSIRQNYFQNSKTFRFHETVPNLKYLSIGGGAIQMTSMVSKDTLESALLAVALDVVRLFQLRIFKLDGLRILRFHSLQPDILVTDHSYPWERFNNQSNNQRSSQSNNQSNNQKNNFQLFNSSASFDSFILNGLQGIFSTSLAAGVQTVFDGTPLKIISFRDTGSRFKSDHVLNCGETNTGAYTVFFEELDLSGMLTRKNDVDVATCTLKGPAMKRMNLKGCELVSITPTFFHGFPILTDLDLSENSLGSQLASNNSGELFKESQRLQYLNLSTNSISTLPVTVFSSLLELQVLDLSNNEIKHWTASLTNSHNLKVLDISRNNLGFIDAFELFPTPLPLMVSLTENPLTCDCMDPSVLFARAMSSAETSRHFDDGNPYQCTNINVSITQWSSAIESGSECTFGKTVRETGIDWRWALTILGAVALFMSCLAVYVNRYSIKYKYYKWKSKYSHRSTGCIPLINRRAATPFRVYLALDEMEEIWPYLIQEGIQFQTRNHQSLAAGFRWRNVVADIENADIVIVTLSAHCLDDNDKAADLSYAIEKGIDSIVTVVKGNIAPLASSWSGPSKCVKRLLSQSAVLEWPTDHEVNEGFLQCLKSTCEAKLKI